MTAQNTFLIQTRAARETDYATAPSGGWPSGSDWFVGGRWFNLVTDGMPTIIDHGPNMMLAGNTGRRAMNAFRAAPGRRWSEGDLSLPVTAETLGLFIYAALGEASADSLFSEDASLLGSASAAVAEPINTNPKSFVLAKQPSSGGAYLRLEIKGTGDKGTVSISGLDPDGNGASELISFASGGLLYSRNAYSSIGASGLAVSSVSAASLTVIGFKKYTHTFRCASGNSGISLTIQNEGNPAAGAASKSFLAVGTQVTELTLTNDSLGTDTYLKAAVKFMGQPTATSNASSNGLDNASIARLFPGWTLAVTRDGGTTYNKVTNSVITFKNGNRNQFAATGAQGPVSAFRGAVEVTGTMTILVDNEIEFNKWRGASQTQLYFNWLSPWKGSSSTYEQLTASTVVFMDKEPDRGDSDGAQTITFSWKSIDTQDFTPLQMRLVNGVPNY